MANGDEFIYRRRVTYAETDSMGIVHHTNHMRYFEEARVEWMRSHELIHLHAPYGPYVFAVRELKTRYFKPIQFDDEIRVTVRARTQGIRIFFQYDLHCERYLDLVAEGFTELIPLQNGFQPTRLPQEAIAKLNSGPWLEANSP